MESIWKLKLRAWEGRSRRSTPAAASSCSAGDALRLPAAPRSAPHGHADGPPAAARGGGRTASSRRKGARARRRGCEGLMAESRPVRVGVGGRALNPPQLLGRCSLSRARACAEVENTRAVGPQLLTAVARRGSRRAQFGLWERIQIEEPREKELVSTASSRREID